MKLYRECVEKGKTDFTVNYSEAASHHKSEIIKYTFLIVINATEFITIIRLLKCKISAVLLYMYIILVLHDVYPLGRYIIIDRNIPQYDYNKIKLRHKG